MIVYGYGIASPVPDVPFIHIILHFPPTIDLIDLAGYYGNPGDVIYIKATDDFRVVKIKVMIYDINDMLIEEGVIEPKNPSNKLRGYYKVTRENKQIEGCVLRVIAFDLPGNEGVFEVTL